MLPLRLPLEDLTLRALRSDMRRVARRLERVARPLVLERGVVCAAPAVRPRLRLLRGGRA